MRLLTLLLGSSFFCLVAVFCFAFSISLANIKVGGNVGIAMDTAGKWHIRPLPYKQLQQ